MPDQATQTESPILKALVDVTTTDGATFLKRAPIEEITLWEILYRSQGRTVRGLDQITELEPLQYLFWNTTKNPPADDLETVRTKCEELASQLEVDQTPADQIRSQIPADFLPALNGRGDTQMAQGSTTEGAIEKPGGGASKKASKKGSKKKAAAAADSTPPADGQAAPAAAEAQAKKEKDPTGRPGEGTSTRKVWDIADSLVLQSGKNETPTRKAVVDAAVAAGVNKATAGVQYGHWMRGMKRAPAPEPPAEKPADAPAAAETAPASS